MLQRLLINLDVKISSRRANLLLRVPIARHSCHQCGYRLYFSHKAPVLRNYYERTPKNVLFHTKTRYFSSQVDVKNSNTPVETVKDKAAIAPSEKINVKLKTSELKRLFGLAAPEKWTLTGNFWKYSIIYIYSSKQNIFTMTTNFLNKIKFS